MKKLTSLLLSIILMLLLCPITQLAAEGTNSDRLLPRLVDEADLLSQIEEDALLAKLDEISERQNCDVAIVIAEDFSEGYYSAEDFADDLYYQAGYGMGSNKDGILLLLVMSTRDWHITTHGFGIEAITNTGLQYMSGEFLPSISNEKYNEGFTKYAELCDKFLTQAKTGKPYDSNNLPKETNWLFWIGGSLLLGIIVGFIATSIMKGQMKSVDYQDTATSYLRNGSMNVDQSRDTFMYAKTTRTAKPKETRSTSAGSRTHTSSSNNTHGGSGGKF